MNCSPPGSFVHEDSPGENTGVGSHALLQGIFSTQGLNPGFPHCRQILTQLSYGKSQKSPYKDEKENCISSRSEQRLCHPLLFGHSDKSHSLWPPGLHHTAVLPVLHQLLELAQTHAHRVGDAIQPAHPLSSPSPSASNLSQHQGLFQWVSSVHQVAKVLQFQLQQQSFQWIFRTNFL